MLDPNDQSGEDSAALDIDPREDLERGLQFTNVMLMVTQKQGNEAVAYAQALLELLVRKGVIREDEVKEPLERARKMVDRVLLPRVRLGEMGDKYAEGQTADVDCANLIQYCQARCCTFKFYLTKWDLDEGVARWDYGNPYWILQRDDGYCVHCDPTSLGCTIYPVRPHTCRRFDCRGDKRIWTDFERRVPAPEEALTGNAPVALAEVAMQAEQDRIDGGQTAS
jgi:Fe-S-cluster containining protein